MAEKQQKPTIDAVNKIAAAVAEWSAEEAAELNLPHVVVVHDHQTGRTIAHGPYPNGIEATVVAVELSDDLRTIDDGVPWDVTPVPVHPVES